MLPNKRNVDEAAIELGVNPAFIKKDWDAFQVIKAISEFSHPQITPIFSGATSLSKGYGLLKRFSEDLDFRAQYRRDVNPSRGERRKFREDLLRIIDSVEDLTLAQNQMEVGSNYFKVAVFYDNQFDIPDTFRKGLQIKISYIQPRNSTETCLETDVDKFSALTWRVIKRDRGSVNDDPAMIRHLHVLYALREIIKSDIEGFQKLFASGFDEDMKYGPRILNKSLAQSVREATRTI